MSTPSLTIDIEALRAGAIVRLRGEVDMDSSPNLRGRLLELVDQRTEKAIIDLKEVTLMDSSGVGTLVEFKRKLAKLGGDVILAAPGARVRSVLEITQLDKFFTLAATVDEVAGE